MSDEIKKTVLNTLAEPIANSAKNITDKPTQNIGTTLADIWYLVFGGISQAADKKKLKYSYALQEFENELKEKISKIPKDKLVEPNMRVVAPALETVKYCVEEKEIRNIFSTLIASSLNSDLYSNVYPSFIDVIKQLSPLDANNIFLFKNREYYPICNYIIYYKKALLRTYYEFPYQNVFLSNPDEQNINKQSISISTLERLGLITISPPKIAVVSYDYKNFENTEEYKHIKEAIKSKSIQNAFSIGIEKRTVLITPYGKQFLSVCS